MAKENTPVEPDFQLGAEILRNDIQGLRDSQQKGQGDLSAAWKRVESQAGLHKAAAKAVFALAGKSKEHQADYLRTFVGLARAMGVGVQVDLVDLAQGGIGTKVGMPGGAGAQSGLAMDDDGEGQEGEQDEGGDDAE